MDAQTLAERVVARMYDNDPFSLRMGMVRSELGAGRCVLRMKVTNEMLNGFGIAHGGITYSLADSCLAFASNSHGIQAVSVETSIAHTRPVKEGELLTATATELERSRRFGRYDVRVTDSDNKTVALFRGTVFRTGKPWFPELTPSEE
ncbi:MAG: hotdog fold thioesterase [Flavobacteriales bacterium]